MELIPELIREVCGFCLYIALPFIICERMIHENRMRILQKFEKEMEHRMRLLKDISFELLDDESKYDYQDFILINKHYDHFEESGGNFVCYLSLLSDLFGKLRPDVYDDVLFCNTLEEALDQAICGLEHYSIRDNYYTRIIQTTLNAIKNVPLRRKFIPRLSKIRPRTMHIFQAIAR